MIMMSTSGPIRRASSARRMLWLTGAILEHLLDTISEPAQASDRNACRLQLVTKPAHVHFQRIRRRLGFVREHGIEQNLLTHDFARTGQQYVEDGNLACSEVDFFITHQGALA